MSPSEHAEQELRRRLIDLEAPITRSCYAMGWRNALQWAVLNGWTPPKEEKPSTSDSLSGA